MTKRQKLERAFLKPLQTPIYDTVFVCGPIPGPIPFSPKKKKWKYEKCTCHLEQMFSVGECDGEYTVFDAECETVCDCGEKKQYAELIAYALNKLGDAGGEGYYTACRIHKTAKSQRHFL